MNYIYNKNVDYFVDIVPSQLIQDIKNSGYISEAIVSIVIYNDILTIQFDEILSSAEESFLEMLINMYTIRIITIAKGFENIIINSNINYTEYKLLAQIYFDANIYRGLLNVKVISRMDNGLTSYNVKLSTILFTIVDQNLNNTSDEVTNLTLLQQEIDDSCIIDIDAKLVGGSISHNVYINSIIIEYY